MEIPVYLFTGFLEAGKTKFIQETLEDKRFNGGEKTLLLVCEEGELEYDPSRFFGQNVYLEVIDDQEQLSSEYLEQLRKKHRCERVIIEYNGMWMLDKLYSQLPEGWMVYQEMMLIDAGTFVSYNANMRSLVVDKLQSCELVVFNRSDDSIDKEEFHKLIRAVNRKTQILYEDKKGNVVYDEIEDELPFDLNAPVVEIADEYYAAWYRDLNEELEKYPGKTVRIKGIVITDPSIPRGSFIIGRNLMTCCVQDIQFAGLAARYDDAQSLKSKQWYTVTAKITVQNHKIYRKKGPVLNVESIEPAQAPENEVATFY